MALRTPKFKKTVKEWVVISVISATRPVATVAVDRMKGEKMHTLFGNISGPPTLYAM